MSIQSWPIGATPPGMTSSTVKRLSFPKDPSDVTPVTGDFRGVLAAVDADSLSLSVSPSAVVHRNDGASSDLVIVGTPSVNTDATRVSVWVAGGSVGFEYLVSITVNTIDDQVLTRSFIIPVNYR